jgi:AraC-like DNA-binding protein
MIYVRRGALHLQIDGASYDVKAPAVIFISRLEQHALHVLSDTYERYTFDLDPCERTPQQNDAQLYAVFTDRPSGFCHVLPVSTLSARLDMLSDMICDEHARQDATFPGAADRLLQSMLLLLFRAAPQAFPSATRGSTGVIQAIRRSIETEPARELTLESLARRFHLNPYYMAHQFKDVTGYSIKNYQLRCRIAAARALLEHTDLCMGEICARVGFSDMSSLSRYFRREVGMTPTAYRRAHTPECAHTDPSDITKGKNLC